MNRPPTLILTLVMVLSSVAVIAESSDAATQYTVTFSSDNGSVEAYLDGTPLSSGDKVDSGSKVTFVFRSTEYYEPVAWIVNDSATEYTCQRSVTLEITEDTEVEVESQFVSQGFFMNYFYGESVLSGVRAWSYGTGTKREGGMGTVDQIYDPCVIGNTIYAKQDNVLLKIDGITGTLIKSVETTSGFTGYYEKVIAGNGYLYDCYAGVVYDQDLEPAYKLPVAGTVRCAYYYDGHFYVTYGTGNNSNTTTYCFSAIDEDPSVPDNKQSVVWMENLGVGNEMYSGVSSILFGDGWMLYCGYDDDGVYLRTVRCSDGVLISNMDIPGTAGSQTSKGYINLEGGRATIALLGLSATADIDAEGHMSNLRTATNPQNSRTSSLITVGDYGYLLAGGVFYVYDVSDMSLVTSMDTYKTQLDGVHANMVVSTGYENMSYIYVLPYKESTSVYVLSHDRTNPTEVGIFEMKNIGATAQFNMFSAHFMEDGSFLYLNDGGILCRAVGSDVIISVKLSQHSLDMAKDAQTQLTATVLPDSAIDKSVTWASSDESVVTVDSDGKLTAVGVGTATITVTTNVGGLTDTCVVSVADISVTNVALSEHDVYLAPGASKNLKVTVNPSDAPDRRVTWSSSDESIFTVDSNGRITAVSEGKAVVTVTSVCGPSDSATVTVTAHPPTPGPTPGPDGGNDGLDSVTIGSLAAIGVILGSIVVIAVLRRL